MSTFLVARVQPQPLIVPPDACSSRLKSHFVGQQRGLFFFLLFWSIFCSVGVLGSFVRDSRLVKQRYFLSLPRNDSITVGQLAGFQMPSSRRSQARWRTIAMMRFAYTRHVFALGRRDADSSTTNNTWSKPISHEYCCLAL